MAALRSCTLHSVNHQDVTSFLGRYSQRAFDVEQWEKLSFNDCLALIKLERMTDYLCGDFCRVGFSLWAETRNEKYVSNFAQLSLTERRRLKRAVYRWQIHFNLFGKDPQADSSEEQQSVSHMSDEFTEEEEAALFQPLF